MADASLLCMRAAAFGQASVAEYKPAWLLLGILPPPIRADHLREKSRVPSFMSYWNGSTVAGPAP